MENQAPKKTRRSRRKKPVEAVIETPTLEIVELEIEIEEVTTPVVEPEPEPEPKAEVKPWKRPCRPMTKREAKGAPRGVRNRQ